MSEGFKGKLKVSTYSHLSFEFGREDITNLLFEAEGLIKIWEFLVRFIVTLPDFLFERVQA